MNLLPKILAIALTKVDTSQPLTLITMKEELLNKIHQGDCLEFMRQLPDKCIDLVVTDPPYGIKMDRGFQGFGGFGKPIARKQYDDDWDSDIPPPEVFAELFRISHKAIIFGGNFFAHLLPQSKHWIVWDKLNTMPTFGDCELAWTNIDRNSVKKFTHQYNGLIGKEQARWHPTQKPMALMEYCVGNYSEKAQIIFDPFAGSGTTLVAAKQLGRKFLGCELSEKYVAIANERLRQDYLF